MEIKGFGKSKAYGFLGADLFAGGLPEIILTEEEAKTKGLGNLIPQKPTIIDWLLNGGHKCIGYTVMPDGTRVPITVR